MNEATRRRLVFAGVLPMIGLAASALAVDTPGESDKSKSVEKKPLDHDDYDKWRRLRGQTLSNDGKWVLYSVNPVEGDATMYFKSTDDPQTGYEVLRGASGRFTYDGDRAIYLVRPDPEAVKKARKELRKKGGGQRRGRGQRLLT